MFNNVRRFFGFFLLHLSCGLWLYSIIVFGFAVAGSLFAALPSHDTAGMLNRIILLKLNILQGSALAGIVAATTLLWKMLSLLQRTTMVIATISLAVLFAGYAGYIQSEMAALIPTITSFDATPESGLEALSRFRSWHSWYSTLSVSAAGLAMALWAAAVYWSMQKPSESDNAQPVE